MQLDGRIDAGLRKDWMSLKPAVRSFPAKCRSPSRRLRRRLIHNRKPGNWRRNQVPKLSTLSLKPNQSRARRKARLKREETETEPGQEGEDDASETEEFFAAPAPEGGAEAGVQTSGDDGGAASDAGSGGAALGGTGQAAATGAARLVRVTMPDFAPIRAPVLRGPPPEIDSAGHLKSWPAPVQPLRNTMPTFRPRFFASLTQRVRRSGTWPTGSKASPWMRDGLSRRWRPRSTGLWLSARAG